jgi:polysaccharide biosynthesis transport protein
MSPLRIQLDRIRRRGWLVLTITLLATLGALAAALGQQTTYTGRATLTIISQNRAPEQDAPLAQGYAEYFNEKSYQEVLRKAAGVPDGLVFSARTAATSPIVYVEATAPDPELAASAAAAMAKEFFANVNANLLAERGSKIAELRNQITAERALLMTLPESSPEASLSSNTVLSLQSRIAELQADTSSQLRELQLNAGVSKVSPNHLQNTALGLVGGLVLGCVGALALAGVENRLATAHEVRDRLRLDTLAIIPGGRSKAADRIRAQRFKRLANVVSLGDLTRPATVAITSPRATAGTARVAEALAYYRAFQGERTLHMCADLHPQRARRREEHEGWPGVADILASPFKSGLDGKVIPGWCSTMWVMPTGSAGEDPYALFGRERFTDLVRRATGIADLVVVEAPPIIEAAEGQVICATADRTILVIEEDVTRAGDAVEACQLLEQVEATLLGVVIIGTPSNRAHQPNEEPPDQPVPPPTSAPWPPRTSAPPEPMSPIVAAAFTPTDEDRGVRN